MSGLVTGILVVVVPVTIGFGVRRIGLLVLLANLLLGLMAAGFLLAERPGSYVASFVFGGVMSELVVIGFVTSWWQVTGLEELEEREDQPLVFGRSHRYWNVLLWISAYHVIRFHRLVQGERARRDE